MSDAGAQLEAAFSAAISAHIKPGGIRAYHCAVCKTALPDCPLTTKEIEKLEDAIAWDLNQAAGH